MSFSGSAADSCSCGAIWLVAARCVEPPRRPDLFMTHQLHAQPLADAEFGEQRRDRMPQRVKRHAALDAPREPRLDRRRARRFLNRCDGAFAIPDHRAGFDVAAQRDEDLAQLRVDRGDLRESAGRAARFVPVDHEARHLAIEVGLPFELEDRAQPQLRREGGDRHRRAHVQRRRGHPGFHLVDRQRNHAAARRTATDLQKRIRWHAGELPVLRLARESIHAAEGAEVRVAR